MHFTKVASNATCADIKQPPKYSSLMPSSKTNITSVLQIYLLIKGASNVFEMVWLAKPFFCLGELVTDFHLGRSQQNT